MKPRGKSGPLFNFNVHDDVRLIQDATREKDEVSAAEQTAFPTAVLFADPHSHAGKVVERSWYNRFKHVSDLHSWYRDIANDAQIFPASRWEAGPISTVKIQLISRQVYDPSKQYGSYVSRRCAGVAFMLMSAACRLIQMLWRVAK